MYKVHKNIEISNNVMFNKMVNLTNTIKSIYIISKFSKYYLPIVNRLELMIK